MGPKKGSIISQKWRENEKTLKSAIEFNIMTQHNDPLSIPENIKSPLWHDCAKENKPLPHTDDKIEIDIIPYSDNNNNIEEEKNINIAIQPQTQSEKKKIDSFITEIEKQVSELTSIQKRISENININNDDNGDIVDNKPNEENNTNNNEKEDEIIFIGKKQKNMKNVLNESNNAIVKTMKPSFVDPDILKKSQACNKQDNDDNNNQICTLSEKKRRQYDIVMESLHKTREERSKELCKILSIDYSSISKEKIVHIDQCVSKTDKKEEKPKEFNNSNDLELINDDVNKKSKLHKPKKIIIINDDIDDNMDININDNNIIKDNSFNKKSDQKKSEINRNKKRAKNSTNRKDNSLKSTKIIRGKKNTFDNKKNKKNKKNNIFNSSLPINNNMDTTTTDNAKRNVKRGSAKVTAEEMLRFARAICQSSLLKHGTEEDILNRTYFGYIFTDDIETLSKEVKLIHKNINVIKSRLLMVLKLFYKKYRVISPDLENVVNLLFNRPIENIKILPYNTDITKPLTDSKLKDTITKVRHTIDPISLTQLKSKQTTAKTLIVETIKDGEKHIAWCPVHCNSIAFLDVIYKALRFEHLCITLCDKKISDMPKNLKNESDKLQWLVEEMNGVFRNEYDNTFKLFKSIIMKFEKKKE